MDIKNTGEKDGDEIVQLYIHYSPSNCIITRPVKELKGFKRIHLKKGQTRHLAFILYAHQLAFYQEDMTYAVNPGDVDVMIGSSSENICLSGKFKIIGNHPQVVQKKIFFSGVTVN